MAVWSLQFDTIHKNKPTYDIYDVYREYRGICNYESFKWFCFLRMDLINVYYAFKWIASAKWYLHGIKEKRNCIFVKLCQLRHNYESNNRRKKQAYFHGNAEILYWCYKKAFLCS